MILKLFRIIGKDSYRVRLKVEINKNTGERANRTDQEQNRNNLQGRGKEQEKQSKRVAHEESIIIPKQN